MRNLVLPTLLLCVLASPAVAGQAYAAFEFAPPPTFTVPEFGDDDVRRLLTTLDGLVAEQIADAYWQFARRLQTGRLSASQEAVVLAHLDDIAAKAPGEAAKIAGPRRMIAELTVGKRAPDIHGEDLEGQPFRLSAYRGHVVVLAFSAEWCAICRTQIPYEQFLRDKYRNWPFVLLGVQTGSDVEDARREQARTGTPQRSWWDVPGPGATSGPIAAAWNVVGWPATYVIDAHGVIRFVDVRDEDLLKVVRQLLREQQAESAQKREE